MLRIFEGPGVWIILVVVLLLFGATRLPALARSIGQSTKILRDEIKKPEDETADDASVVASEPAAAATTAAQKVQAKADAAPTKSAKPGKSGKTAKP